MVNTKNNTHNLEKEIRQMWGKLVCSTNTISFLLLIGIFCTVAVVGCSKKETEDKPRELVILCGSSFPKPMEQLYSELTSQTGIKVTTTVAGK